MWPSTIVEKVSTQGGLLYIDGSNIFSCGQRLPAIMSNNNIYPHPSLPTHGQFFNHVGGLTSLVFKSVFHWHNNCAKTYFPLQICSTLQGQA